MGRISIIKAGSDFSLNFTADFEFDVVARLEHHSVSYRGKVLAVSLWHHKKEIDFGRDSAGKAFLGMGVNFDFIANCSKLESQNDLGKKLRDLYMAQNGTPLVAHMDAKENYSRKSGPIFLYQDRLYKYYKTDAVLDPQTVKLELLNAIDRESRRIERLTHRFDGNNPAEPQGRIAISESVRIAVWRRDGGKCAKCGSRRNLEYDHIIPVSKGGSNTERNIELLCESCNREKSSNIQ